MTSPAQPTSVSIDDIEQNQQEEQNQQPNLEEIKLEGDDVPQILRGKSVKEAIAQFGTLEQAFKLSEVARTQAETRPAPTPPAPEPEPEPELTDEQIAQMHEENPLAAIQAISDRAIKRAERNLEMRLGPLVSGTAAQVESSARTKYADEFALFGDQITQIAASVPRGALSNPGAWDDLVALVRGRPGNLEKLIEHKQNQTVVQQRRQVQQQEVEGIGFSDNSGGRGRPAQQATSLDPLQREVADKMGMTPDEYIKWMRVS